MWWGRKPDLSHIRLFGSQAYVHIPDVKRSKLDHKARKLTFVGYSLEHKGYRFVDLETDEITISRDVRFIEDKEETSEEVNIESLLEEPSETSNDQTVKDDSNDEFTDAGTDIQTTKEQ